MSNSLLQSIYILVHKENPDRIWHMNSYRKQMINTIPVFRSVHSAKNFKNEIMKRNNHFSKWCLSTDTNTREAVFHTELEYVPPSIIIDKNDDEDTCEIEVKRYDFAQTLIVSELIKYNIALLYIDRYWLKQSHSQIVVSGLLWHP